MLASTCSIRRRIAPGVSFLSRVFTALKRLPSTATVPPAIRPISRHRSTNWRQTARIASPLFRRKSAMVLKSGASLPVSHMHSTFAPCFTLQSPARLHLVQIAVQVELEHCRRAIPGSPGRGRPGEAKCRQIQFADKHINDPNQVVLGDIVIQAIGKQEPFLPVFPLDKASHTKSPDHPGENTISGVSTQPPPTAADSRTIQDGPPSTQSSHPTEHRRSIASGISCTRCPPPFL